MATSQLVKHSGRPPEHAQSLLEYWQHFNARGQRPTRSDFTPFSLKQWLGHIDIYDVEHGGEAFRLRLNGSWIVAITGEDWTGKTAHDVDHRFGSTLHEDLYGVYRAKQPLAHDIRLFRKDYVSAYRLLLPIFSDTRQGEVVQVFLAIFDSES
jgi:hypothetical protein